MTWVLEALTRFFGGFGVPVYPEGQVPETAAPPYITVEVIAPGWEQTSGFYARIWDRSGSLDWVSAKAQEIGEAIGAGAAVQVEGGAVWIYRDAPFAQLMPTQGDRLLRCAYLRLKMQALTD